MSGFFSWWSNHFTPMLSWWQWLLILAVPPAIVLLYFLKLRREPLEVPSTFLWRKSIEDLHVNSIWQKLRQNLLLFLQLLIVALAIFALLRPGYRGSKLVGDRFVFLVDNSASMNARDIEGSRLTEAKRKVAEMIDQMRSGDVGMIVSFSDSARVEQPFTDNRRELRRRLDEITPSNRSTSLGEALRVAAGLANTGQGKDSNEAATEEALPTTLYIVSDGKFPDVQGFALGRMTPNYMPVGKPAANNLGITSFAVQKTEGASDRSQAFTRIENYGDEEANVQVTLLHDDVVIDVDEVKVAAHESAGVAFKLSDIESGVLEVKISPGGDLQADDRAWAVVSKPRRGNVLLVTPKNDALSLALGTPRAAELAEIVTVTPDFLDSKDYQQKAASGTYDLMIYDQCQPKEMPQANTLFIGRLPPLADWGYQKDKQPEKLIGPQIIDVESSHPLMQLIDLGNVIFVESVAFKLPPGGSRLIDSNQGILFAVAPREAFEDAVLGAEIVGSAEQLANTDWPRRLSFPVFVFNVVEYLAGGKQSADATLVTPGKMVTLRSANNADRLTVRLPSGTTKQIPRSKNSTFNFNDTEALGVYRVEESGVPTQSFAVNLFNSAESDIRPRPENSIKIGYVDVTGEGGSEGTRRELWRPLLLAAFLILLGEWYIYNRRVYI